jgi:hypothetical protein
MTPVRFPPHAECDDVGMSWAELKGEAPCLSSATEIARLDDAPNDPPVDFSPPSRAAIARATPCGTSARARGSTAQAAITILVRLDRILLDLRHAPFSHGQAYVAISRVHVAADCGVFVNDRCCVQRQGARCAVLGSVVYEELLSPPCDAAPAARPEPSANPNRRPHLSELVNQLDDRAAAQRVRRSEAAPRKRKPKRTLAALLAADAP